MALRHLFFEPLESRQLLAVLTVNSLLDNSGPSDGLVTLREAVAAANANAITELGQTGSGADTVEFSAALSGTVNLSTIGNSAAGPSALNITSPVTIRGNSNGITLNAGAGATAMRHFRVAANGNLTLDTIMLTGGVARGASGAAGENGGDGRGGAIYNEGTLNIIASTLYNNKAIGGIAGAGGSGGVGRGGAIYNAAATVTIRNATFSGNQALNSSESPANSAFGGSVHSFNGNLQISNTTMTNGTAQTGKGVYLLADGGSGVIAHIESTIIAENGPPSTIPDLADLKEADSDILIVTGTNNLIRRAINFNNTSDVDPLLSPLANNGGPTLTHAVQPLSPAINNGSNTLNLTTDQRGATFSRVIAGAADIGAFEQQAAPGEVIGDYNRDTVVDAADYVLWRKTRDTTVETFSGADGNGDGHVDDDDYDLWTEEFGNALGGIGAASSSDQIAAVRDNSSGPFVVFDARTQFRADERKPSMTLASHLGRSWAIRDAALLAVFAQARDRAEDDIGQAPSFFAPDDADCAFPESLAMRQQTTSEFAIDEVWHLW